MIVRFARPEDIPALCRLLRQVGRFHHQGRPDLFRSDAQKYGPDDLLELLKSENHPIFVAETHAGVVGYGMCIVETVARDPVLRDTRSLYLDDLCVDEQCRGQKIGSALYQAVAAHARKLGCSSVTLNVWSFDGSALGFYEKCGLRPRKVVMEDLLEEE